MHFFQCIDGLTFSVHGVFILSPAGSHFWANSVTQKKREMIITLSFIGFNYFLLSV